MSLLLVCMWQYCYAMLMFPFKGTVITVKWEQTVAELGRRVCANSPTFCSNYMLHIFHIIPTCKSSSSLKGWMSFITCITFTPSDIVFSNCVDLFTFKGQPLPRLNSTWQRIVRRGQLNACISPASKRSKLIYPINEEWGLMLMRDDNLTGQLFFYSSAPVMVN